MSASSGKSSKRNRSTLIRVTLFVLGVLTYAAAAGLAQVSPSELANPRLKAAEKAYYPQLLDLSHEISRIGYPFKFALARYPGLDPGEQTAADARGLEFIYFQDHTVLKISGNYNAAFNSSLLAANQRVNRVFEDVIVPVLRWLPAHFSSQSQFDGIGFEIAYHVRTKNRSYDYEGAEVLTLVFDKADALGYLKADGESGRQEILNRSLVYLNGKAFGLALGSRDPFDVEGMGKLSWPSPPTPAPAEPVAAGRTGGPSNSRESRLQFLNPERDLLPGSPRTQPSQARNVPMQDAPVPDPRRTLPDQAAADALQAKVQSQLDAWGKEGRERFHFVDYAPPSFVIFKNQIYLQVTLHNPAGFDRNASSIYKRAAQSFDLFLAPLLKAFLDGAPGGTQSAGMAITVVNDLVSGAAHSSEAIEFVCPLRPLQEFANGETTTQDLINQSVVFVNGVRIGLNLQQAE